MNLLDEFRLPYPPTINHYYVNRRDGGRAIGKAGKRYRVEVVRILKAALVEEHTDNVQLEILVYPPDRRKRDLDNILKALLDALQHGGAIKDDSQVSTLYIKREEMVKVGEVIVKIWSADA